MDSYSDLHSCLPLPQVALSGSSRKLPPSPLCLLLRRQARAHSFYSHPSTRPNNRNDSSLQARVLLLQPLFLPLVLWSVLERSLKRPLGLRRWLGLEGNEPRSSLVLQDNLFAGVQESE